MSINKDERRFLRHWEEQRKGSRVTYYLLFGLVWTFTAFLCLFFVFNNFIEIRRNSSNTFLMLLGAAIILGIGTTHLSYMRNEKRFKRIIDREVQQGSDR